MKSFEFQGVMFSWSPDPLGEGGQALWTAGSGAEPLWANRTLGAHHFESEAFAKSLARTVDAAWGAGYAQGWNNRERELLKRLGVTQ